MMRSRWVSTALVTLVAWYAAAGAGAPCVDPAGHDPAGHDPALTHHADITQDHHAPCTPDSSGKGSHDTSAHCRAMAGCAAQVLFAAVVSAAPSSPASAA